VGGNEALGAANPLLQRIMIGIQIENHDIAIASSAEEIDPILIRLDLDLEFLAKG
jgi:hypothetical protein